MPGCAIADRAAARQGAVRRLGDLACDGGLADIESIRAARTIKHPSAAALREGGLTCRT